MIVFWIAAALLSAAAAALVVHFAAREPVAAGADPAASLYRRQLDETDDLAERGLLGEAERQAAHAEAARRLLGAPQAIAETPPTRAILRNVVLIAFATALVAAGVYSFIGKPGTPDQPFKLRAAQWAETIRLAGEGKGAGIESLDPERLAVVLKAEVAKNPDDPGRLFYLSRFQLQSGQKQLGIHNLRKLSVMAPNQPDVWATLGEALVDATKDETVTPEAAAAFTKAVALDPKAVSPRFYLARAKIAGGDVQGGLADWRALAKDIPPGDQRLLTVETQIAAVEKAGGLVTPGLEQGPTADMIKGMVQSLADKLKQNPDDPEGWAKLVRSYGVLGDKAKQEDALVEARRIFKDRPADLKAIQAAVSGPPQ
ncbi:c-type cytochrome biogenesis protein CcmI [soil metagenome]